MDFGLYAHNNIVPQTVVLKWGYPQKVSYPCSLFKVYLSIYLSIQSFFHSFKKIGREGQKEERQRISSRLHTLSAQPNLGLKLTKP